MSGEVLLGSHSIEINGSPDLSFAMTIDHIIALDFIADLILTTIPNWKIWVIFIPDFMVDVRLRTKLTAKSGFIFCNKIYIVIQFHVLQESSRHFIQGSYTQ